jgi:CubicO group peptidase (beta-lactamase class C family)
VLGELLAQHFGQSWAQLVHQGITGPLGMTDTTLLLDASQRRRLAPGHRGLQPTVAWSMSAAAAAGGLHASVPDLLKLGHALLLGEAGPLGEAAVLATTPLAPFGKNQIGYAWIIRTDNASGRQQWFHDGKTTGYRALMVLTPVPGEVHVTLAANSRMRLPATQP